MTSVVTVDASAGHSISVEEISVRHDGDYLVFKDVVRAGEVRDFHIWENRYLIIREMQKDDNSSTGQSDV